MNNHNLNNTPLEDGRYLTNVWCHPPGVREREVTIVDGVVQVPRQDNPNNTMAFSQSTFFGAESNYVVKKLD